MALSRYLLTIAALAVAPLAGCAGESAPTTEPIGPIDFDALFVVNGGDATISVIDTATDEVAATIALRGAEYPHHLYMTADRAKLGLAVPGIDLSGGHGGNQHGGAAAMKGAVMILEAITGETLASRFTDTTNHNAAFSKDAAQIWTSQMASPGEVLVLDAGTLDVIDTVAVGDSPAEVTFTQDGAKVFVADSGSKQVTVLDVATREVLATLDVGENPVGAWQAENGNAYVDNEASKSISVVDTETVEVTATFDLGFTPAIVALGPDGDLWVADTDAGRVVFLSAADGAPTGEVATGKGAHAITFTGDGAKAYVSNQLAGNVTVIDVAKREVIGTVTVGEKPNGLVWRGK